jgi:hypothetical protein
MVRFSGNLQGRVQSRLKRIIEGNYAVAIKTSTFSGWQLSGEDAQSFLQQIENSQPNELAQASLKRGEKTLDEYLKKGYAVIKPK